MWLLIWLFSGYLLFTVMCGYWVVTEWLLSGY